MHPLCCVTALTLLALGSLGLSQPAARSKPTQEKAVRELMDDLKSTNGRQIYDAFQALGGMGARSEPALPQLVAFLKNSQTAFVVTNFRSPQSIIGPERTFTYAAMSRETLAQIGAVAVPSLL